jgi:hypothetical protein
LESRRSAAWPSADRLAAAGATILGEVDDAHLAFAEYADDLEVTELIAHGHGQHEALRRFRRRLPLVAGRS